jgi:23S rRNA pseudouridine2605 synthase
MPKEFRHKKSRAAEDSPKPAKKSTGKTKPEGDKPKYERKPKFDGDKPRFDGDKPKYERKPKFDGDKPRFDGDKPKYERKPKFDGDKPRFDGDKPKYERKPKFDGDKPRFDGEKPKYDRKPKFDGDKPRFDGDKPKFERKPKFDGDKSRFEGDKPKYERKPKFEGEKPRFDGDKPKYERKPKFDGDKLRFDGDKPKRGPRKEQRDGDFAPNREYKGPKDTDENNFTGETDGKPAPKGKGKSAKNKSHLDPKSRNAQRRKELSTPKAPEHTEGMRLNKYVAHCGVASRRETAELIKEGKVTVNNVVVKEPFYQIKPGDVVHYKGKAIRPEGKMVYLLMNKPRNVITTTDDERGRKTVLDLVEKKTDMRVFPVGRLDRDTTGLLLLTNDGELAQKMTHPSYKIKKVYHAVLNRPISTADLEKIRTGLELEDGLAPVDSVDFVPDKPRNEVGITIHIGRNRIVRRIFAHLGYEVERLDRTYLGGLTKKDLPRGFVRHLNKQEVIMLKHFTGK